MGPTFGVKDGAGEIQFSGEPGQKFIGQYKIYDFKDKSCLVRAAVDHFKTALEKENLKNSAVLYAEIYAEHQELKSLMDSALSGWPK